MIEKVSIIDATVSEIKKMIESGEYTVGQKLPTEKSICDKLGIGRSSVREAFRILQAKGYVEMRPGKGAFVASADGAEAESAVSWFSTHHLEILDFMEVRIALETLAVKLAIERGRDIEFDRLALLYEAFEFALRQGACNQLAELDERFHTAIMNLTHNRLMININKNVCEAFKEYRARAFDDIERARHALLPHKEILEAIKNRDVEAAQRAMLSHLEISLEDIKS